MEAAVLFCAGTAPVWVFWAVKGESSKMAIKTAQWSEMVTARHYVT
jgi:hypothetical protein